ncbi:MAG: hypothetical protein MJ137_01835 [Clostridia bacterium]|nr:hypothetical protein [Clostridia bacterium]
MMLVDVHSHMLPGIDDGSRDAETSAAMLKMSSDGGVSCVFVTPHYYPTASAEHFLEERAKAAGIIRALSLENKPGIKTGAEVYYHIGIQHEQALNELCYEGTRCILVEMPWNDWGSRALHDVSEIYSYRGFLPVIAHLERYESMTSRDSIKWLKSFPCLIQMNAEYIIDPKTRKKALKAIKHGEVDLLGSDAHGIQSRVPNLGEAFAVLNGAGLKKRAEELLSNAERLWNGEMPLILRK